VGVWGVRLVCAFPHSRQKKSRRWSMEDRASSCIPRLVTMMGRTYRRGA
jgi:hypothetical protein